ncbi:MAG: DedA family protein [Deltaproteobacteria bacterium]|nr:DedA family protein [Deltaproteobacteria bacterium]
MGLSAYFENLFPPIPGDTITALGAFLVGIGKLNFFWVYLSTTFGSLMGFLTLFRVGGYVGRRFFIEKDYPFITARNILKAEEWFYRYGCFLIAMNRFLPGVRSAIALAAGISKLKASVVAPLALLSCSVWNLIWILLGKTLGSHLEIVESNFSVFIKRYNTTVILLFMLILLFWFVRKRIRK